LSKAKKPKTAHISRVVIERDGVELQILRQSYPWGTVREAGLYFTAYTKSLDVFDLMLARMMGATGSTTDSWNSAEPSLARHSSCLRWRRYQLSNNDDMTHGGA
jgi:deferrochelatase/peroxidase EfeB